MIRSLIAFLLSWFLIVEPCAAQLTQEQLKKAQESNRVSYYEVLQRFKDRYEATLAKEKAEHDPAVKARLEYFVGKDATEIAANYERPNINSITGLPPDYVQARHWYALGTEHGDTDGAYWLAELYWDGKGGPVDKERAKALWLWAADNGERKAVVRLEGLGYNMQKERELAFGKAQAPRTQQDDANDAAKGLMVILGALLIAKVAHDINETPECREARLAILAGTAAPYLPPGCN